MKKILLVVCVVMVAVMLATMFVACSAEDYAKKLEKKDYKVTSATSDDTVAMGVAKGLLSTTIKVEGELEFIVVGVKEGSTVAYIKFEKTEDAKKFATEAKKVDDADVSRSSGLVKFELDD